MDRIKTVTVSPKVCIFKSESRQKEFNSTKVM